MYKCRRTPLFRYERFINSLLTPDLGSRTRGERHNSYYADHTIWPHQRAVHLVMLKISFGRDPKNLTAAATVENSTLCLNCRKLNLHFPSSNLNSQLNVRDLNSLPPWSNINPQLNLFQNPQILPGMTSSTLHPHFLSGVYYDNGDCHILCKRA